MNVQQELPIFEDLNDALRSLVSNLGGTKMVAAKLWPEKSIQEARTLLSDCLNPTRREKLSPHQVLLLLRWGREAGYHTALAYICQSLGYDTPRPLSPKDEAALLLDRAADLARESRGVAQALDRLASSQALMVIGAKSS